MYNMANFFWGVFAICIFICEGQQQQQQQQGTAVSPRLNPNDPCTSKSGLAPHESHCDKYYDCVDGLSEVRDCPNGLVYYGRGKGLIQSCGYPWDIDCTFRPNRNVPIGSDHCEWKFGISSHETSCTRYWTCWNGTAIEQFCIGGLLYNDNTHACDWPDNVAGCQKHPLCKDEADGRVPLGKSCTRFWQCIGGYPRLMRCPATLVFDKISRRCVNPPTEDCDVITTTPNPNEVAPSQGGPVAVAGAIPIAIPQRPQQSFRPIPISSPRA